MAAPDKETLTAEVTELHDLLKIQYEKNKQETLSQGRSFNPMGWWAGAPDSQKYPPGPAFVVRDAAPCVFFILPLGLCASGLAFFYLWFLSPSLQ